MKYVWCVLFLAGMFACTSDIELDQSAYSRQIVVDGWIETNGFANVYVTLSSSFLNDYDSVSIRKSFLNYARVTLSNSASQTDTLTLFRDASFFPPYVYRSTKMKGMEGETYQIKVEVLGKVLTASTTIPKAPVITNAYMDPVTDSSCYVRVNVRSESDELQWLFTQAMIRNVDHYFHPSRIALFSIKPSIEKEITIYRSKETNLSSLNTTQNAYSDMNYCQYYLNDTVDVKIGTVDDVSYQVLKSLALDKLSVDNPFVFNKAGIISNISGGIGRWTGIGMAPIRMVVK